MENKLNRDDVKYITQDLSEIKKDIKDLIRITSELKVKSSIWGALGGMIPCMLGLILWLFGVHK